MVVVTSQRNRITNFMGLYHCYWFRSGRKISYQSLHRHEPPPCSTSGWTPVDSGPFRSFRSISVSFGRYTNSSWYWNQNRSTHIVTAPVTWRNASHHSNLLFLLQLFCAFHPLQLFFLGKRKKSCHFLPIFILCNSCCGYFLPSSTFYCA